MRFPKAFALAMLPVFWAAPSYSTQIYTFNTTDYGTNFGLPGLPLNAQFLISDAAVARGLFSLTSIYNGALNLTGSLPVYTGDANDFIRFSIAVGPGTEVVQPDYLYGSFSTRLAFDSSGNIASSFMEFLGEDSEADISGIGNLASGLVGSDFGGCNSSVFTPSRGCSVSGNYTHTLAEPPSIAIIGLCLVGMGLLARRAGNLA